MEEGSAAGADTSFFHGIISRGLLNRLRELDCPSDVWHRHAHLIGRPAIDGNADLRRLQDHARACQVLTFKHSAFCAARYVEQYCRNSVATDDVSCALWKCKEGHTSSVWHAIVADRRHGRRSTFAINVARDAEAGRELTATAERMRAIAAACPDVKMARVLDCGTVSLEYDGVPVDVAVTRNEWVEGAREIHPLTDLRTGRQNLILVERFLCSPLMPSRLSSIVGRRLTDIESAVVEHDVARFLEMAARSQPISVNLEEGDLVWNGTNAVVVAVNLSPR